MRLEEIILGVSVKGDKKTTKQLKDVAKATKQIDQRAVGASLSLLFFGQSLQRTFSRIATSSMSAFQTIMATVRGSVTATSMLSTEWEYLKFTIGAAINETLGPLMPIIQDIITAITDWIDRHPQLTTAILGAIITIGFLLSTLTSLKLAFEAFDFFAVALGLKKVGDAATAATGAEAAGGLLGFLGSAMKLLGILYVLYFSLSFVAALLGIDFPGQSKLAKEAVESLQKVMNDIQENTIPNLISKLDTLLGKLEKLAKNKFFKDKLIDLASGPAMQRARDINFYAQAYGDVAQTGYKTSGLTSVHSLGGGTADKAANTPMVINNNVNIKSDYIASPGDLQKEFTKELDKVMQEAQAKYGAGMTGS